MNNKYSLKLIGTLAVLAIAAHGAQAQSGQEVVLRQGLNGYDGTSTTLIISGANSGKNYGNSNNLIGGAATSDRRSLIRFDLTDFVGQTVVGDATLRLVSAMAGSNAVIFDVLQVSAANADWVRGTGSSSGTDAKPGESAWAFKVKGEAGQPDVLWAGTPGLSSAGVDYIADPVATLSLTAEQRVVGTEILVTIPQALLQFWIDNPSANGGLLLANRTTENTTLYGVYSVITGTEANRPELSFQLAAIPEPSTYALMLGGMALVFIAVRRRRN